MRLTATCLALALSLAAPGAHAAEVGLPGVFKAVCLDTLGDAAKAVAILKATGWQAASLQQGAPVGMSAFEKLAGDRHWELVLQDSVYPADSDVPFPTHRNVCTINLTPDTTDIHPALRAIVGVDPSKMVGPTWGWTYVEHGTARDFIKDPGDDFALKALQSGPLVVILAGPRDKGNVMLFSRVARVDP